MARSTTISVGSHYGQAQSFAISRTAQNLCSFLSHLPSGSSLPKTRIPPFQIVLQHLTTAADHLLAQHFYFLPSTISHNTATLLLFAQTWALAACMGLPDLQDKLVIHMRDLYLSFQTPYTRNLIPVDNNITEAFRHLAAHCGPGCHAEKFLVSFIGGFAEDEFQLATGLFLLGIEDSVRRRIINDARAGGRDSIVDDLGTFLVECEARFPRYEKPVVRGPGRVRRGGGGSSGGGVGGGVVRSAFVHVQGNETVFATAVATASAGAGFEGRNVSASAQVGVGVNITGGNRVCPRYGNQEYGGNRSRSAHYPPTRQPNGVYNPPLHLPSSPNPLSQPMLHAAPSVTRYSDNQRGLATGSNENEKKRRGAKKEYEVQTKLCGLLCLFDVKFLGRRRGGGGSGKERERGRSGGRRRHVQSERQYVRKGR